MSYDSEIDKDRSYFTQNYKPIRLRCPECVRTNKVLRHCRIFKNLSALGWHLKREHGYVSNISFNSEDLHYILNALSKAIDLKIIAEPAPIFVETTTTSSLQYRGKPPRKDVWQKLDKISQILKNQSHFYPDFKIKQIRAYIGVVLGTVDGRTVKNYFDCIIAASEKNSRNGTIDVTQFCDEFDSGV